MTDLPTRLRVTADLYDHRTAGLMRDAADEIERLRKGIQDMLDGNYPHPRSYRPKQCPHGAEYWHECPSCNDAALQAILTPPASPASTPIVNPGE